MSDGGGVQDLARDYLVKKTMEKIIELQGPLVYHPLVLPAIRGKLLLDPETQSILQATLSLLNTTNPNLVEDCWLCLEPGPLQVNAILINSSQTETYCLLLPLRSGVYLSPFSPPISCFILFPDNSSNIDVGQIHYSFCQHNNTINGTQLCPPNGTVFMCGGEALSFLPQNWTGLCTPAIVLPDVTIVPDNQSLPVPTLEHIGGKTKRAIQAFPLILSPGVAAGARTGIAELGTSFHFYKILSQQLIDDLQAVASTILDLQAQLDSLAAVVLQNRRGLNLLTAEKGGLCLFLQEECCFYANRSGIVQDKVKRLKEDLEKQRKELQANFLWTGLHGWLPYLLPFLGPILLLLLLFTFGPCIANKVIQFIQSRIESIQLMTVQIQYQRLTQTEDPYSESSVVIAPPPTLEATKV
ncbi:syncytin-1-like [Urocitellus parryii]